MELQKLGSGENKGALELEEIWNMSSSGDSRNCLRGRKSKDLEILQDSHSTWDLESFEQEREKRENQALGKFRDCPASSDLNRIERERELERRNFIGILQHSSCIATYRIKRKDAKRSNQANFEKWIAILKLERKYSYRVNYFNSCYFLSEESESKAAPKI